RSSCSSFVGRDRHRSASLIVSVGRQAFFKRTIRPICHRGEPSVSSSAMTQRMAETVTGMTGPIVLTIANNLEGVPGVIPAYLFGSMANGRAHRESDVDVGLLLERKVYRTPADRFEARLRLAGRLGAAVARDVDLVILNDSPPQLARHILTRG